MARRRIQGITIELDGETKGLDKALSDVNKRSRDVQKELRDVERLLKFNPKNTELLAQKQKLLGDQVENTRQKLDQLRQAEAQVQQQFERGEISEEQYRAFQREIVETESKLRHFESQLEDTQTKLDRFGERMNQAGAKVKAAGDKMTSVGKTLTASVTAPILGAGAAAVAAADDIDQALNTIQVGTGATGDALTQLEDDFRAVFADVPTSADAAANAISNLNTLTGASGPVLQDLTKNVLEASRVLGEDGAANAAAFGQAITQWNVPAEEGTEILDKLFKATQDYGIGLDQLSGQLSEYGSVLMNAGFEMDEAADLFGRLHANGISVSRVMPGLNRAFRNWASEGKNSQEELTKVIEKMQEAETETEALAIAADVFGAEGAQRLTTAVRNGVFALDDLGGVLENSQGLINETAEQNKSFAESMMEIKNQVQLALEPLGEILLELAHEWLPRVSEAIQNVAEWFQSLSPEMQKTIVFVGAIVAAIGPLLVILGVLLSSIGSIISTVGTLMPLLGKLGPKFTALTGPVGIVIAVIGALIAIGIALWKNWDTIREKATEIWGAIREWLSETWEKIKRTVSTTVSNIWRTIRDKFNDIKNAIFDRMNDAWDTITGIWEDVMDFLRNIDLFQIGKDIVQGLINGIKSMAGNLIESAKGVVDNAIKAAKNLLGISSPSKVFMEFGEESGRGLELGLKSMASKVAKAGEKMAGAAVPDSGEFGYASGTVNNTYNLAGLLSGANIEVRSDQDIKRLAQELGDYIMKQGRGRGVMV